MEYKLTFEEVKQILLREKELAEGLGLTWKVSEDDFILNMKDKFSPEFMDKIANKYIEDIKISGCIVEADNLLYMITLLCKQKMAGKFNIIILDPPYNTGDSSKPYNDQISNWLSFMYKRLVLSKELLDKDGVVYICINDKQVANLKLLCDKVFGEENFVNLIGIKTSTGGGNSRSTNRLRKDLEYVLVYSKEYTSCKFKRIKIESEFLSSVKDSHYKSVMVETGERELIADEKGKKVYLLKDFDRKTIKNISQLEQIPIKEVYFKYFNKIFSDSNSDTGIRAEALEILNRNLSDIILPSLVSLEYTPEKGECKGETKEIYYWISKGNKIRQIIWFSDVAKIVDDKIIYSWELGDLWNDISFNNLGREGGVEFQEGKKPVEMYKRLIKLYDSKDCLIGDFFAGSGTTGEAVKCLNDSDKGSRQFVLCNWDENDICVQKTYKRVKEFYPDIKFYKINNMIDEKNCIK